MLYGFVCFQVVKYGLQGTVQSIVFLGSECSSSSCQLTNIRKQLLVILSLAVSCHLGFGFNGFDQLKIRFGFRLSSILLLKESLHARHIDVTEFA